MSGYQLPGHLATALSLEMIIDEANKLAKEAAQEASTFNKGNSSTSMADVKFASHTQTMTLWQSCWSIVEVGSE